MYMTTYIHIYVYTIFHNNILIVQKSVLSTLSYLQKNKDKKILKNLQHLYASCSQIKEQ